MVLLFPITRSPDTCSFASLATFAVNDFALPMTCDVGDEPMTAIFLPQSRPKLRLVVRSGHVDWYLGAGILFLKERIGHFQYE